MAPGFVALLVSVLGLLGSGGSQARGEQATDEGVAYEVDRFVPVYVSEAEELPPAERLLEVTVELSPTETGWVAAREDLEVVRATPNAFEDRRFHRSAIRAISGAMVRQLRDEGFDGVLVSPDGAQISPVTLEDRREDTRSLQMLVLARQPEEATDEGDAYTIEALEVVYHREHADLPDPGELLDLEVELTRTATGWVAPRPRMGVESVRLSQVPDLPEHQFHASAIRAINQAILAELNRRGLIGVLVIPDDRDIEPSTFRDLREGESGRLRLKVYVGVVTEVRTLASGDRIPEEARENHPAHERILERSPVQVDPPAEGKTSLVRRDVLDEYLFRLNRHPGRRVDVAVAQAEEPHGVALDYLVTENKPWVVYYQGSNTGTPTTNRWRHRFGFTHNQLTGNDDVLTLEYIASGEFDTAHAVVGSYEAPLFDSERLRWQVDGSWAKFNAADIGFADEQFRGEDWNAGGELRYNFYQDGPLFLDIFGGAGWSNVEVENVTPGLTTWGKEDFFVPRVGLSLDRHRDRDSTRAFVKFEWNLADVAGTDGEMIENLQRTEADKDWRVLSWLVSHSMYLEPLIDPEGWRHGESEGATLAHELVLTGHGQYGFGDRLVPRHQQVLGGLYTVRGYPESWAAGDTVAVGTAEYRFHLPRALPREPDPSRTMLFGEPFRWTPQQPYGTADWDLIFRAFVDAGYVRDHRSHLVATEGDNVLVGSGVGLEFVFKQNLSLRADWGVALKDTEAHGPGADEVEAGDNRFHFVFTVFY